MSNPERFGSINGTVVTGHQFIEDAFTAARFIGLEIGQAGSLVDQLVHLELAAVIGAFVDVNSIRQVGW